MPRFWKSKNTQPTPNHKRQVRGLGFCCTLYLLRPLSNICLTSQVDPKAKKTIPNTGGRGDQKLRQPSAHASALHQRQEPGPSYYVMPTQVPTSSSRLCPTPGLLPVTSNTGDPWFVPIFALKKRKYIFGCLPQGLQIPMLFCIFCHILKICFFEILLCTPAENRTDGCRKILRPENIAAYRRRIF